MMTPEDYNRTVGKNILTPEDCKRTVGYKKKQKRWYYLKSIRDQ